MEGDVALKRWSARTTFVLTLTGNVSMMVVHQVLLLCELFH